MGPNGISPRLPTRASATETGQRLGLRKVFPASASDGTTVDIIAIHGLDTESPRAWTYKKDGSRSVNWLEDSDMLPAAGCRPRLQDLHIRLERESV